MSHDQINQKQLLTSRKHFISSCVHVILESCSKFHIKRTTLLSLHSCMFSISLCSVKPCSSHSHLPSLFLFTSLVPALACVSMLRGGGLLSEWQKGAGQQPWVSHVRLAGVLVVIIRAKSQRCRTN